MSFELQETTIHGHRVAYRQAGSGAPIVLIHGITASSRVWELVGRRLARHHTVLAPDLLGHGETAKPRGDSTGAFASGWCCRCWPPLEISARRSVCSVDGRRPWASAAGCTASCARRRFRAQIRDLILWLDLEAGTCCRRGGRWAARSGGPA